MKDFREIVKILVVGLAVMVALPLAYRAWLHFHPQPSEPRPSLSKFLAKAAEDRAMRLIRTPLSKWSDADRKSEPKIHAWLESHANTILPWEWTDEAQRKDPSGYRKLWLALLKEQERELGQRRKDVQKKLKAVEHRLLIAETMHAHRTNQIARVREYASANSFPMSVKIERLSKGRFWGWNTKTEDVRFESREDFDGERKGWLAMERENAEQESRAIVDDIASRKSLEGRLGLAEELLAKTTALEGIAEMSDSACLPEIFRFINAKETLDED